MQDYRATLNIAGWVMAVCSTLFIVARLYVRLVLNKGIVGWDDWSMLAAWVLALICTTLVSVGTRYGFGQHITDIAVMANAVEAAKYVFIAPVFSLVSSIFCKLSIIIAFMRIMGRTRTIVHLLAIAYIPMLLLLAANLFACAVIIFYCNPINKAWNQALDGKCMDPKILDLGGRTVSAYNAAMDVFCAVVPFFLIRRLTLKRREKRNLIILMGASIFGSIATIMKIVNMSNITNVADVTWTWAPITIWYLAENHVLIMAGSVPTLRSFWRAMIGKYTGRSSSDPSNSRGPKNSQSKNLSASIHLSDLESSNRKKTPGLYTMAMRDDSSEEGRNSREHGGNNGKDTESIESILPKDRKFDRETEVTITALPPTHSNRNYPSRSSFRHGDGIQVTKEISQHYDGRRG